MAKVNIPLGSPAPQNRCFGFNSLDDINPDKTKPQVEPTRVAQTTSTQSVSYGQGPGFNPGNYKVPTYKDKAAKTILSRDLFSAVWNLVSGLFLTRTMGLSSSV